MQIAAICLLRPDDMLHGGDELLANRPWVTSTNPIITFNSFLASTRRAPGLSFDRVPRRRGEITVADIRRKSGPRNRSAISLRSGNRTMSPSCAAESDRHVALAVRPSSGESSR